MNFDAAEARHFLELPDGFKPMDLRDAEEMGVFPLRDFFLRNSPVRPLWETRIRKLETIASAVHALGGHKNTRTNATPALESTTLIDLLSTHQNAMAALKTSMSSDCTAAHTAQIARIMMEVEEDYMAHFLRLTKDLLKNYSPHLNAVSGEAGEMIAALRCGNTDRAQHLLEVERRRITNLLEKIRK